MAKMTAKPDQSKEKTAADGRFEFKNPISRFNGKYEHKPGYWFSQLERRTDIPGTKKNTDIQRNGRDIDVFIDAKPEYVMANLRTGMVDMSRFHNNRESP
jgi:hypothetical protein